MAVLYTVTLGGNYGIVGGGQHSQVLIESHVHDGTDFEMDITNPGWDWAILIVDVEAETGANIISMVATIWVEKNQNYQPHNNGSNDIAAGAFSFADTQDGSGLRYPCGVGAGTATWDAGLGRIVGPLPGKFRIHFDASTSADLTFSMSAWMGHGQIG